MTSLRERIFADHMTAFKDRDTVKKVLLSTVKGEIQNAEKNGGQANLSDGDVLKILTKMCKSLNETLKEVDHAESHEELLILSQYLPKQMSREDAIAKLNDLKITNGPSMNIGLVMKAFSADAVDKKMVSELFLEMQGADAPQK